MSKFQLFVTIGIIGLIVLGVLVLSGAVPGLKSLSGGGPVADLTMWGTISQNEMRQTVSLFNDKNNKTYSLTYVEKDEETYEDELVNALAAGSGPDIFMVTQDLMLRQKDKIQIIPYASFDERTFKNTFIDAAEVFLFEDGVAAVPFLVDPMVVYWNKRIFNNAAIVNPPEYWEEFLNDAQLLTQKDYLGNIAQSGAAVGEFSNIKNAKDIFSMMLLQSGNKIIEPKTFKLVFGQSGGTSVEPAFEILTFFTSFADPSKVSYSWNRALPNSEEMFISGKLAMYFGFAGEYNDLKEKNPHLDFDIAMVPQVEGGPLQATFGKIYALAVSKVSPSMPQAIGAISAFLDTDVLNQLQEDTSLPPVVRALLAEGSSDAIFSVFYKSAIQARTWLEPNPDKVSDIFKSMIENTVVGKKSPSTAIIDARKLLSAEMDKIISEY